MSEGASHHWPQVAAAVKARMEKRGWNVPRLAKATTLSPNTIRAIRGEAGSKGPKAHRKTSLVMIAVYLDWPWNYLLKIDEGFSAEELDREIVTRSPAESLFREQLMQDQQRIGDLREATITVQSAAKEIARIIGEITADEDLGRPPDDADPSSPVSKGTTGLRTAETDVAVDVPGLDYVAVDRAGDDVRGLAGVRSQGRLNLSPQGR